MMTFRGVYSSTIVGRQSDWACLSVSLKLWVLSYIPEIKCTRRRMAYPHVLKTCICSSYNSGLVSQKVRINFNGPGKCHWSGHWGLLVKPDGFLDWKSMYISLRRVDHWPIWFEPKPFKAGFLFEFLFQRIHLHAELHGYHIDPSNHFLVNYSNFREYSILAYVDNIAHSGYSNGSDKLFKVHEDQWNVGLYVYLCKDKVEGVLVM